jgi:hypothetical protein
MGNMHLNIFATNIPLAQRGRVAWSARRAHNPEIGGSNPPPAMVSFILENKPQPFFAGVLFGNGVCQWFKAGAFFSGYGG